MIKWENMTSEDINNINIICKRVKNSFPDIDYVSLQMDLHAVHMCGCKLDFLKLLEFDEFNFAHDIYGIMNHINRESGELKKCFLPRCLYKEDK